MLQEQGCPRSEWFVHTDPCSSVFLRHFVRHSRPLSVSVSLSMVYGRRSIVAEFSADVSDGDDIAAEHRCMPGPFLNKVVPLCSSPDRWEDQDEERSRRMCQVTQRCVSSIHFMKYLVLGNQKSIHASQITSAQVLSCSYPWGQAWPLYLCERWHNDEVMCINSGSRVPALPPPLCVVLGGSLVLPQPWFPHLAHGDHDIIHLK